MNASRLSEHSAAAVVVEQAQQLGVEQHDRLLGADRVRVRERELRQVEARDVVVEVEHVEDLAMEHPDAGKLLFPESDRGSQRHRSQRAFVPEGDELAHDLVQVRDALKRRGGRPVGRMLVGARRDALELECLDRERHPTSLPTTRGPADPRSFGARPSGSRRFNEIKESQANMGLLDKITGKAKQAAGDVTGDPSLRREGRKEERKGEAKEELASHEERADDKAAEVADLERNT
jgi:uncharacterized protein YjbJ (UPF0337 family)